MTDADFRLSSRTKNSCWAAAEQVASDPMDAEIGLDWKVHCNYFYWDICFDSKPDTKSGYAIIKTSLCDASLTDDGECRESRRSEPRIV